MNSYTEYCKVFTKGLKTAINKHKGPCSAKEFDNMISGFVTELYRRHSIISPPSGWANEWLSTNVSLYF